MQPLAFKTKVWIYITSFTTVILVIAFGVLATTYYWLSLNSFKKELVTVTKGIINNHLVFENDQILFKKDNESRTISAYLRDENVSAIFFDSKLNYFATYGIYQKILVEDDLEKRIDVGDLKLSFEKNSPTFKDFHLYNSEEYFILNTPILFEGNKVGIIQVAIMTPFFSQVKSISLYLLLAVVCFSLLISWPLSQVLLKFLFKPLDNIIASMEQARLNNLSIPLHYSGHPKDDLSTLVSAYNKMLSRLASGFDRQKDFISHASHELKTPLSRSISSLEIALLNIDDGKYDDVSGQIKEVRDDLFEFSNLIGELLILSKVDSGMVKLQVKAIKLAELIDETITVYTKDIGSKNIHIIWEVDDSLQIAADITCTRLILSNLISNAIKYSKINSEINIVCKVKENNVSIVIQDHGIGMSQVDLLKIFDRFFRSPEVSKTHGFGIGMSLVKQLATLHHLTIDYQSVITKGTTVTISGFAKVS